MDELWKEIPGSDYSVSNLGRVASRWRGGRILKPWHNSNGYLQVDLFDGGEERRSVRVHHLVAAAFLPPKPTPKHQTNHIDGDRANPRADNLEWVTPSENQLHRYAVLKHGGPCGEANGATKLTEADVREIRRRCAAGESQRKVATGYGIHCRTVWSIVHGESWAWLT